MSLRTGNDTREVRTRLAMFMFAIWRGVLEAEATPERRATHGRAGWEPARPSALRAARFAERAATGAAAEQLTAEREARLLTGAASPRDGAAVRLRAMADNVKRADRDRDLSQPTAVHGRHGNTTKSAARSMTAASAENSNRPARRDREHAAECRRCQAGLSGAHAIQISLRPGFRGHLPGCCRRHVGSRASTSAAMFPARHLPHVAITGRNTLPALIATILIPAVPCVRCGGDVRTPALAPAPCTRDQRRLCAAPHLDSPQENKKTYSIVELQPEPAGAENGGWSRAAHAEQGWTGSQGGRIVFPSLSLGGGGGAQPCAAAPSTRACRGRTSEPRPRSTASPACSPRTQC